MKLMIVECPNKTKKIQSALEAGWKVVASVGHVRDLPARLPIDLLRPFDASLMTEWKVSADVGNVRNDCPELLEPLAK
jgi:DNA topoisomerase-1